MTLAVVLTRHTREGTRFPVAHRTVVARCRRLAAGHTLHAEFVALTAAHLRSHALPGETVTAHETFRAPGELLASTVALVGVVGTLVTLEAE